MEAEQRVGKEADPTGSWVMLQSLGFIPHSRLYRASSYRPGWPYKASLEEVSKPI